MEYSVGSLADLVSGSNTPNKPKVIEKKLKFPKFPKKNKAAKGVITTNSTNTSNNAAPDITETSTQKRKKSKSSVSNENTSEEPVKKRSKKIVNDLDNLNADDEDAQTPALERKLTNAEKRIKAKKSKLNVMAKQTHEMYKDRTIFVGNVPIGTKKMELRKHFIKYGGIESVRFRCVPVPDEKTSKKVAAIKSEFHSDRTSLHSYIKFNIAEDSIKALAENGKLFENHHIRVSHCDSEAKKDETKAIFIGNLSFDCEEEELWKAFERCGTIESVRLIRDRRTNIGKGFGYINFASPDGVELALQMGTITVKNREVRISACNLVGAKKNKKKQNKFQKQKNAQPFGETPKNKKFERKDEGSANNFQGIKFTDIKKKQKFNKSTKQKNKVAKIFVAKTPENS